MKSWLLTNCLIFAFVHLNRASIPLDRRFFQILPLSEETTVQQCLSCNGNCTNPSIQMCDGTNNKCFGMVLNIGGSELEKKGCLPTDAADNLCSTIEDAKSCYICNRNLCNSPRSKQEPSVSTGVQNCYVCIDQCEKPTAQHNCNEALNVTEGKIVPAACISFEIKTNDTVTVSKGCIANDDTIKRSCLYANFVYPDVTCKICESDLCNGNAVEECYFCENDCQNQIEIQKCQEIFGKETKTKCASIEIVVDGQLQITKKCINGDDVNIKNECNKFNEGGGNCTICDGNLCNGNEVGDGNGEKFVEQCYTCGDLVCKDHLKLQDCKKALGQYAKSKCISMDFKNETYSFTIKQCVEDAQAIHTMCNNINQSGEGKCVICDTNFCNLSEDDGNGNGNSDGNGNGDGNGDGNSDGNSNGDDRTSSSLSHLIFAIFIALLTCI